MNFRSASDRRILKSNKTLQDSSICNSRSLGLRKRSKILIFLGFFFLLFWYSHRTHKHHPVVLPLEPSMPLDTVKSVKPVDEIDLIDLKAVDHSGPDHVADVKVNLDKPKFNSRVISKETYKDYLSFVSTRNKEFSSISSTNPKLTTLDLQSSYQCLGRQTDIHAVRRRPCRFKNVCYHRPSLQFQYYNPSNDPVFYDSMLGPLYKFQVDNQPGFIQVNALPYMDVSWFTPMVTKTSPVSQNDAVWVQDTTAIFASWSREYNFGHFVFEELASAYTALVRFGIYPMGGNSRKPKVQLLDLRHQPNNKRYLSLLNDFMGAFSTPFPVRDVRIFMDDVAKEKGGAELVCFHDLVVSSATQSFLSPHDEYQMGTEPIWAQYRSDILLSHGIDPLLKPTRHQMLILKKTKSLYKSGENRVHFRDIVNFDEMVNHIKLKFGSLFDIIVFDPSVEGITMTRQLEMISKTTILVTCPGGISMLVPFLPPQSHAIVLDYYESLDNGLVSTRQGESVTMEASLWNVFPHVYKHYYQIMDPDEEIVPDFEGASDTREDFSVKVNPVRMEYMINVAISSI